jgi:hypothetical protein
MVSRCVWQRVAVALLARRSARRVAGGAFVSHGDITADYWGDGNGELRSGAAHLCGDARTEAVACPVVRNDGQALPEQLGTVEGDLV